METERIILHEKSINLLERLKMAKGIVEGHKRFIENDRYSFEHKKHFNKIIEHQEILIKNLNKRYKKIIKSLI